MSFLKSKMFESKGVSIFLDKALIYSGEVPQQPPTALTDGFVEMSFATSSAKELASRP